MSRPPFSRALAAALAFPALVVLSLPLGMPVGDRYTGEGQEALLGDLEKEMARGARFHRAAASPGFPLAAASCDTCHTLPPHSGEGVAAAMNNHHSSIFDCLVCHWAGRSGKRPNLNWSLQAGEGGSDVNAGREKLLLLLEPPPGGAPETAAALREKLLATQKCFDRGPACRKCHTKGGMTPYARPGMPDKAKAQLEELPDFYTLPGGSKWYFPQRL